MKKTTSLVCFALLFGSVLNAHAQDERGWTFSGRLQGSSSSSGAVLKADPSLGYVFNRHIETYAGVPFYFVNPSSNTTGAATGSVSGPGNVYAGIRAGISNPAVNFISNLVVTAPTGDKDKGFSTGKVTADWTNTLSRRFSRVLAFGSAGVANTVSDTSFFVRPFSSLGLVGHFDGGATLRLAPIVDVGAAGYAVRGSGEQRVFSKVVRENSGTIQNRGRSRVFETATETVGSAEIANDHGFSTWMGFNPFSRVGFEIGYTRSVTYQLDTVFFGAGFRVGK
jgi:hypothetical protein